MGASLMLESIVMADFCEKCGYDPVVLHGISMGGNMAALSATVMPRPVGVVPCLAWTRGAIRCTNILKIITEILSKTSVVFTYLLSNWTFMIIS